MRASTKISVGDHGTITPEIRLGWAHEFLDAAQTLNAAITAVPGTTASVTGANFGRDTALVGASVTHAVNASTNLFLDYDGRVSGGLQEHAFSAGLKVTF